MIGTAHKSAWFMLKRIRVAMGQQDKTHQMNGIIEFDDAYFGGPTVGKSRAGAQKRRKFLWYCLWMSGVIPAF